MPRTVFLLMTVALLVPAAAARADEEITASPGNRYDNPNPTIDQGERLTFRNNDLREHDVTSTPPGDVNGYLFQSRLVGFGESSFVEGSQYLTTGTYAFACSIHPEMQGTLTVTSAGTPVPRPGSGGPPADTTPPALSLKASRPKARARKLAVTVTSSEAASLVLTAKVGSSRVARAVTELVAGEQKVTLKLSRRAARRLRRGRKVRLAAAAKDTAGNTGTAKLTLKVR